MDKIQFVRLQLLSQSKNLLNLVRDRHWDDFSAMNSIFQASLTEAFETYGQEIEAILPELIADNDQLQKLVKEQQLEISTDRIRQIKKMKQVKTYLKETL